MTDTMVSLGTGTSRTGDREYSVLRDAVTDDFFVISNTDTLGHIEGELEKESIRVGSSVVNHDETTHEQLIEALVNWGTDVDSDLTITGVQTVDVSYTTVEVVVEFENDFVGQYRFTLSPEGASATDFGNVA